MLGFAPIAALPLASLPRRALASAGHRHRGFLLGFWPSGPIASLNYAPAAPIPPTPESGGGGGGRPYDDHDRTQFEKRQFIRRQLEKAIRDSLEPPKEKEAEAVQQLVSKPQRARIFPDAWKQEQVLALVGAGLDEVAALVAKAVAMQRAAFEAQVLELAMQAEDAEVAALVADLMAKDIL